MRFVCVSVLSVHITNPGYAIPPVLPKTLEKKTQQPVESFARSFFKTAGSYCEKLFQHPLTQWIVESVAVLGVYTLVAGPMQVPASIAALSGIDMARWKWIPDASILRNFYYTVKESPFKASGVLALRSVFKGLAHSYMFVKPLSATLPSTFLMPFESHALIPFSIYSRNMLSISPIIRVCSLPELNDSLWADSAREIVQRNFLTNFFYENSSVVRGAKKKSVKPIHTDSLLCPIVYSSTCSISQNFPVAPIHTNTPLCPIMYPNTCLAPKIFPIASIVSLQCSIQASQEEGLDRIAYDGTHSLQDALKSSMSL